MPRPPNQKMRLLIQYRTAGDDGLTDEQAAQAAGLYGGTTCWWHRCSDLRADYLIEQHAVPQERKGSAGVERMVCVISDAGRAVLEVYGL